MGPPVYMGLHRRSFYTGMMMRMMMMEDEDEDDDDDLWNQYESILLWATNHEIKRRETPGFFVQESHPGTFT